MPFLSQLTGIFRCIGSARLPYLDIDSAGGLQPSGGIDTWLELLDCEFSSLTMTPNGFVDSSIGATADEADDLVAINHPNLTLISHIGADSSIRWVCCSNQQLSDKI